MKHWYDGWRATDKLVEAGNNFEKQNPHRNIYVEALEEFLEKRGLLQ